MIINNRMEKVSLDFDNSKVKNLTKITSLDYLIDHKTKIWIIGFVIRLALSTIEFSSWDYEVWRIPVTNGLSSGKGLYGEVKYNHMPISPYLSTLMLLLVNTDNKILIAMAIKFPQVVFDSLIPLVIFKLGIHYNKQKVGAKASILYALNPISIYEISNATFHSIAAFFTLSAFYFMLTDREYLTGIFISLGFLTSQYPFVMIMVVIIYWKKIPMKAIRSGMSFLITTSLILFLVLFPFGTSIHTMINNLIENPNYQNRAEQGITGQCPRESFTILHNNLDVSFHTMSLFWLAIFIQLGLIATYYYFKNTNDDSSLHLTIIYIIMLSAFFNCIHTKYILWLLPFIFYWALTFKSNIKYSVVGFMLGYLMRRMAFLDYHNFMGEIILFGTGMWVYIYSLNLIKANSISIN